MEFGSFVNMVVSGGAQREPEVGMPATICHWSDREPATVVEVLRFKSGAKVGQVRGVVVTRDTWTVVKGSEYDGSAQYEYESKPYGTKITFLVNARGQYVRKGGSDKLALGSRERYSDPSF